VLLPVLAPFSYKHADGNVRLGRATDWQAAEDGVQIPSGQRMFSIDGEDAPLLTVRKIEFTPAAETVSAEES